MFPRSYRFIEYEVADCAFKAFVCCQKVIFDGRWILFVLCICVLVKVDIYDSRLRRAEKSK